MERLPISPPRIPTERVIRRRGSTRRFKQAPIAADQLATLLDRATRGIPVDCLAPGSGLLSRPYLIVNAVEGLAPGAYVFDLERRALQQLGTLQEDTARRMAGRLCLGQRLGADAAVNVYHLVDLAAVLERFGERGYRLAQLDAAISAGRLYLAAYALGLGATGLTFFDDDVIAFFSPHAAGKDVMFLMALGVPQRVPRRPG
jgi:nitroreductase